MATQTAPPNPPAENPTANQESKQAVENEGQMMAEPPQEVPPKSVFVNSQPIREDQVQNAVNFLSHPRVRGSPVVHRRNFLEKKGLTKEEIDEAFRRVPDPSPPVASGQSSTYQDPQGTPSTNIQTQAPAQAMQPVTAAPSSVMSTMTRRFHWSHAVLAVGFLAVSGAGTAIVFKNAIVPRLKSWIRRVVLDEDDAVEKRTAGKPSLAEEAAAAAKAAAAAAADVAKASQEMVLTKNEEKKWFAEFMTLLDVQLQEIRTMRNAIAKLEGRSYIAGRNTVREEYLDGTVARSIRQMDSKSEFDMRSVRSASPPTSNEPPHPKSYTEIMAMVQRGERPPNVRDIDDRPPNPNQPISNPSLTPRAKPWQVGQSASSAGYVPQPQVTSNGASYTAQDYGGTYQVNNDSLTPWRQERNARITEIENGDGSLFGSGSNGTVSIDPPPQRRWVPPQPPPVSMPEAAVAIRQPKSSVPKDVSVRAEDAAKPISEVDELQRITMISESGGQLDVNGRTGSSEITPSEIQEQVTEL
uniref:Peroxisomal membrane protein PEX14 n=1 Tax=Opuntia streptacantha TaxID=393608 RepID=A0A7C9ELS4_OPUST